MFFHVLVVIGELRSRTQVEKGPSEDVGPFLLFLDAIYVLEGMIRKWIVDLVFASLLFTGVWHGDLLGYAWNAARGQFRILLKARAVQTYLSDPAVPDSLKRKVLLIQEIKQFTIDSLGFVPNKNYTTIYDQQGKPLLWVVTGSKQFALAPYYWKFPVVGKVSYKGFFSEAEAKDEARRIEQKGYETRVRQVNAWSTLGWFRDPIMTGMLDDTPGNLANLIIHELSHRTVYVKHNVDYSENLANFIGDKGARLFLKYKYGANSKEYQDYVHEKEDYSRFAEHLLRGAKRLDSLYANKHFINLNITDKINQKQYLIQTIVQDADTLFMHDSSHLNWLKNQTPNNASFIIFRQYNNRQEEFEDEYQSVSNGKLKDYVSYLRTSYPTAD